MNPRHAALSIFEAALAAADPAKAIERHVAIEDDILIAGSKQYPLSDYKNVYVAGAGKAGATMTAAIEKLLGDRITGGVVNVKDGHLADVRRVRLRECGHPIPDERGIAGAREIAEIASEAGQDDLLICPISGGASALLPLPVSGVSLADKQETTRLLLECGATIHEINAVRKHLSRIKGGWLAALAFPATVLSLILSDVIGNDLDVIGSGITAPDTSTYQDALGVYEKFAILEMVPSPVRAHLQAGASGRVSETPKADHPAFSRTQNLIVGSSDLALNAAADRASELGYRPLILSSFIDGETREIAGMHAAMAKEVRAFGRPVPAPCCLISGGETTVTIRGPGKGGRNQEFTLAAAIAIAGLEDVAVLSAGTDGTDGPTDAAGAIADGQTVERAASLSINAVSHLARNDSYPFFEALGDLVKIGPTGTNVMDVRLVLAGEISGGKL